MGILIGIGNLSQLNVPEVGMDAVEGLESPGIYSDEDYTYFVTYHWELQPSLQRTFQNRLNKKTGEFSIRSKRGDEAGWPEWDNTNYSKEEIDNLLSQLQFPTHYKGAYQFYALNEAQLNAYAGADLSYGDTAIVLYFDGSDYYVREYEYDADNTPAWGLLAGNDLKLANGDTFIVSKKILSAPSPAKGMIIYNERKPGFDVDEDLEGQPDGETIIKNGDGTISVSEKVVTNQSFTPESNTDILFSSGGFFGITGKQTGITVTANSAEISGDFISNDWTNLAGEMTEISSSQLLVYAASSFQGLVEISNSLTMNGSKINNLQPGTDGEDAVNLNQLQAAYRLPKPNTEIATGRRYYYADNTSRPTYLACIKSSISASASSLVQMHVITGAADIVNCFGNWVVESLNNTMLSVNTDSPFGAKSGIYKYAIGDVFFSTLCLDDRVDADYCIFIEYTKLADNPY